METLAAHVEIHNLIRGIKATRNDFTPFRAYAAERHLVRKVLQHICENPNDEYNSELAAAVLELLTDD